VGLLSEQDVLFVPRLVGKFSYRISFRGARPPYLSGDRLPVGPDRPHQRHEIAERLKVDMPASLRRRAWGGRDVGNVLPPCGPKTRVDRFDVRIPFASSPVTVETKLELGLNVAWEFGEELEPAAALLAAARVLAFQLLPPPVEIVRAADLDVCTGRTVQKVRPAVFIQEAFRCPWALVECHRDFTSAVA
jgi:hypothetical protein